MGRMMETAYRGTSLVGLCILGLVSISEPARTQAASPAEFTFGLFGDLGYSAAEEPLLDNVLSDLNHRHLAFLVHVGDLGRPRSGSCSDALWARRFVQFSASANPLIYTPGDNDWTDCHAHEGVTGGDPLERLSALRAKFFAAEQSFGQRTIALTRQSSADAGFAKYRENVRWEFGGITFLTLHVVGSNNGRGRTAEGDAEFAERNSADLVWLAAGFEHARVRGSRAIMIAQQANIFPAFSPFPGNPRQEPSGYAELREALGKEAAAFGKPVVLVHGDSHYFRIDKPFMRRPPQIPTVENFTRVEGFGSPYHHWLEVSVAGDDPNVFTFHQRIVAPNILGNK
jgi:hypothetical protein